MIDPQFLKSVLGVDFPDATFDELGLVDSALLNTLTFLDEARFMRSLADNRNIAGVLATPELAPAIKAARADIVTIEHEDPRWAYFTLYNHVAERDQRSWPSEVSDAARTDPSAIVSETNVRIGAGTSIGANVTILGGVSIGRRCVLHPGTVVGSDGFELKRTSHGLLSVIYDGAVEIGDDVRIGSNCH